MSADPDTAGELDRIAEAIAEAERRVGAGERVDLGPLAARVEAVCAALTGLPGAEARPLAERLPALIRDFDRLAATLRDAIAARGGRVDGAADSPAGTREARARAAAAYARGPGAKGRGS